MRAGIAKYTDVTAVVKVCRKQHEQSSWKELKFNPVHVKRNLLRLFRSDTDDVLVVKDDEGKIGGVLLASLNQFFVSKELYATDIHFMCDFGGIQLFAEFKRWAIKNGASMLLMGIANDDETGRIHKFYEAMGMKPVGDAWVLKLEPEQEQEKAA